MNNGDTEEVVFYNTRVATEAASAVQIDDGFNVDAWAGPLASAGLTAKTGFVELSEHHALCLLRAYESILVRKKTPVTSNSWHQY